MDSQQGSFDNMGGGGAFTEEFQLFLDHGLPEAVNQFTDEGTGIFNDVETLLGNEGTTATGVVEMDSGTATHSDPTSGIQLTSVTQSQPQHGYQGHSPGQLGPTMYGMQLFAPGFHPDTHQEEFPAFGQSMGFFGNGQYSPTQLQTLGLTSHAGENVPIEMDTAWPLPIAQVQSASSLTPHNDTHTAFSEFP